MNRPVTALLAALDAVIAVAIGVGIALVPLTLLWAIQFGLAVDWLVFWRASAALWLSGNGVDLLLTIDPALAARLGVAGAELPFETGIALLGFALVTLLLGVRGGRRLGATAYPVTGAVAGVLALAGLAVLVALGTQDATVAPSLAQALVFPALVYLVGLAIGYAWQGRRVPPIEFGEASGLRRRWQNRLSGIDAGDRGLIALAVRSGAVAASAVVGVAAVAMTLILVANFSSIVALYESLQAGILGGISLTLAQLALLPNLVVWTASWFVGPGFALGTGSAVSPLGTQLGLVPALPVLGALPQGTAALGFVGLLVPVLIGFATGALLRPAFAQRMVGRSGRARVVRLVLTAMGGAAVGAGILALLAVWAGGAAGPGRLVDVGPDPGWVALWAFVELSLSLLLGLVSGATRRPDAVSRADAPGTAYSP